MNSIYKDITSPQDNYVPIITDGVIDDECPF
jgi:hypothetical protein